MMLLRFIILLISLLAMTSNAMSKQQKSLFLKLSDQFAEKAISKFVSAVGRGETYPLMHVISTMRYEILKEYLEIKSRSDTKECSLRRNKQKPVSPKNRRFCKEYDKIIDSAKQGVSTLDIFERTYFHYEGFLLREVEIKRARDQLRKWIHRKLRCLKSRSSCGRYEVNLIARVIGNKHNLRELYRHILTNLDKKLFPEEAVLEDTIIEDLPDSPCVTTGNIGGMTVRKGMVLIPKGVFIMGASDGREDEKVPHAVELDEFWIDRCEVSNVDYLKYLINDPYLRKSSFPQEFHSGDYLKNWNGDLSPPSNRSNYPVVYVTWYAARYYCQAINKRLPSEAEWEKAARAGSIDPYSFNEKRVDEYAWYNENSNGLPHLLADKLPNSYQLYDMHGNVWEWVYDWYGVYSAKRLKNPQGAEEGKYRILRGGSWSSPLQYLRSSMRGDDSPINANNDVGFRCAATKHPDDLIIGE